MQYVSTRGGSAPQSFTDVLLTGLAHDGGLAMPTAYPVISDAQLSEWRKLNYSGLAFEILSLYATDIPAADLKMLVEKTYTAQVYCNGRDASKANDITPLTVLEDGVCLLELSNGPTLAFKDMAMQLLGNLFEYVLTKQQKTLNILGATSGDTGSAAEYAMRGKRGVNVFMLSPHQKMSAFQAAQMYSLQDANIHNIAIKGVFDQAQDIVKAVSNDLAFKEKHAIGTVNSINWARIVAQVVYYFKAYFLATTQNSQRVSFTVPSGNFGNVLAGHIARQMGLPIDHLVVATNENNVLDEFFKTGVYRVRGAENTYHTSSPSMDISKASNFERFMYDVVDQDAEHLKALWQQVEKDGVFDFSNHSKFLSIREKFGFLSGSSSHQDRLTTIKNVHAATGLYIDPHTADGVKAAREHRVAGTPMIVLETALPVKFNETMVEALGFAPPYPEKFVGLESLPQRVEVLEASVEQVKSLIQKHTSM